MDINNHFMKKIFSISIAVLIIITSLPVSASAHTLTEFDVYKNYYTSEKAANEGNTGDYQFAISSFVHIDGNNVKYCFANDFVKTYYEESISECFSETWQSMITGECVSSNSEAHVSVAYGPNPYPIAYDAMTHRRYVGYDHIRIGVYDDNNGDNEYLNDATITFYYDLDLGYDTKDYCPCRKRLLAAHEFGHLWGIKDLYYDSTTLNSIYSNDNFDNGGILCSHNIEGDVHYYSSATRHDFNAMRICLENYEYDTGSSDSTTRWKYQKSPGVWAANEWIKVKNTDGTKVFKHYNSEGYLDEVADYSISYKLNGGENLEEDYITPVSKNSVRITGGSERENCSFAYWEYNGNRYEIGDTITGITGDITLSAVWSATVTYSSSGSDVASDTVEFTDSGELVITKTSSWAYRKFIGWTRPDDTTVYSVGDKITGITGDTTLTAKWEDIYVVLTYDAKHLGWFDTQQILFKNITGISGNEKAISCKQLLSSVSTAYTFVGWQIVGGDSTIYVPGSTVSLPGFQNYQLIDVVEKRSKGMLFYDEGEGQMESTSQLLYATRPRIITKEEPTRTGYTFLGWATTEDGDMVYAPGSEYEGQFNETLYAKWISDDFVIRYDTGTDTTDEVQAYDPPLSTVYTAPGTNSDIGIVISTVVPKRDGYTFLGWSYGDELYEGGERFILPASVSAAPSADGGNVIKLTAVWERYPEEVLISFFDPAPYTWLEDTYYTRCVTRGGTYGNAYLPSDGTMTADFPTVPDLYGKYFIGWADAEGELIGEGSKVTEDDFHMLYSAWVPHKNFTDLEYGSSASRSASICAQFGIMQGVSDSVFSPNATVTRGTAATVLYRLEGSPVYGNNVFYDVVTKASPDDDIDREQSMAVTWITENGFAGALDANADACYFGVTENITRAQLVTVLYRYALEKGLADDRTVYPDTVLDGYTDKEQLGQWGVKPMQWAVSTGLISGTSSTTLSPNDAVTRIALATVTTRMIQRLISNGNFEHSFTPDNVNEAAEALGYVSKTLDNNSWETVSAVSAAGIAKAVWNVGDEKTVTLSTGESVTVQIYGFDHDDLSDGSGKAGITFGLKDVMQNARRMHSFADNTIPLSGNEMGVWLNGDSIGDVYDSLPPSLQNSIRAADKVTSVGGGSEELRTESYKVFLFSEVECFGRTHHSVAGEGEKYAIFTDAASRVKILEGPQILEWWLRSPRKADGTSYCIVHSTGNAGYTSGSWPYAGVNFGFCI